MNIKSRKLGVEVFFDAEGNFRCPKQKQRQCMTVAMCMYRKVRRYRGCVTCAVPNQIARALNRKKA